jgi:hypothetical protein
MSNQCARCPHVLLQLCRANRLCAVLVVRVGGWLGGPAEGPCLAVGNFSGGIGEGPQFRYQAAALLNEHLGEDVGNGSAAVLIHRVDESSTRIGEPQHQITAVGGVIASVDETGLDESVAHAGGVGGVDTEGLGDEVEVLRAAAGDDDQHTKLRQGYLVFHLRY